MLKTVHRSWALLTPPQKRSLIALSTARVLVNIFDVVGIALIGITIAILVGSVDAVTFLDWLPAPFLGSPLWLLLLTAMAFMLKTLFGLILFKSTATVIAEIEVENSRTIARSVFSGGLGAVKKTSRSEIEWTILRSTGLAFGSVLFQAVNLVAEASSALMILSVMILADWGGTLGIVLYFAALIYVFHWFSSASFLAAGSKFATGNMDASQVITDLVKAFREIAISNKIDYFLSMLDAARAQVARSGAHAAYLTSIPRLVVESALILGVIAFLGLEIALDGVSADFSSIGVLLVGAFRMMSSVLPLQRSFSDLKFIRPQAQAAQDFLAELFGGDVRARDEEPVGMDVAQRDRLQTPVEININDVTFDFSFDRSNRKIPISKPTKPVIEGVSFSVPAGAYVALIGPSGAGKSTLIDLILGLLDPVRGEVQIAGVEPKEFLASNPGAVGYVPQLPGIVSGSVANNIALGVAPGAIDEDRVWEVIRAAELEDFVARLPDGIHSDLGSHSDSLSGGQKQRLGLGRALYSKPLLLVLDEATSALDAETESSVTESLQKLRGQVTIIVVAHRLSTVQNVDKAFVVVDGQILAKGTFSELMKEVPLVKHYVELMSFD